MLSMFLTRSIFDAWLCLVGVQKNVRMHFFFMTNAKTIYFLFSSCSSFFWFLPQLQEAKFLASLEHPNIIKLRGMAAAGTQGFASLEERGYFLLLDRLQCTLEDKIDLWREYDETLVKERNEKKRRYFLAERLHVAFDVCAALDYLHTNQIIYRDLKPDNIGFDIRGKLLLHLFPL